MAEKKCQECGATFTCSGDTDCWCESVQLHRKEMIEIMERFSDCLCPECLRRYEKE